MRRFFRPLRTTMRRFSIIFSLLLFAGLVGAYVVAGATTVQAQTATPAPDAAEGYDYTVKAGDSWSSLAARTGFTITQLQAANPQSVRATGYLLVGETLRIPPSQQAPITTPGATQTYEVSAGESWNSIAQKFGVPAQLLRDANPQAIRNGLVLYRGERLIIPALPAANADDATPTAALATTASTPAPPTAAPPTAVATAAATTVPPTAAAEETPATRAPTATAEPATATTAPAATETAAATGETESSAAASTAATPGCPAIFAQYANLVTSRMAAGEDVALLLEFLRSCEALDDENSLVADVTGDGRDDLVLTLVNPRSDAAAPQTDLFVFVADDVGMQLSFQAQPAGQVRILATDDINFDGQPDLVWVDTTCGASTCFDSVYVRSWDGAAWQDWTAAAITMAYADIELAENADGGQGQILVLEGGVYGSVGAGPQRSRTEVWGSIDGAPYRLLNRTYAKSNCLYHKVLDANDALAQAGEVGLAPARELYNEAVTNRLLTKCWQRNEELEELKSFSLFRLALIDAYAGDAVAAAATIEQLGAAYPGSIFTALGQSWLNAYADSGDVEAACAAATAFATANPAAFTSLSDYGYANPTFSAADICPVLDAAALQSVVALQAVTPPAESAVTDASAAPLAPAPEATLAPNELPAVAVPDLPGMAGELPECPANLAGYAAALPTVIAVTLADPLIVETWLRLCDGMNDERGGLLMQDLDGDGVDDALIIPTLVSDLGYGPGGVQGALLIYHGQPDGSYELVYSPDILGQPRVIAGDDVNGDGLSDLIYTVASCGAACLDEVRIITWDAGRGEYAPIAAPGAFIANGDIRSEDLPEGVAGQGKQLVLTGGVSGSRTGGIETPRTEIWRTFDGESFRRIAWTYDRTVTGNDCLGLRLVEANVALQAADVLGYAPAAALYQAILAEDLRSCSIYGIPGSEEQRILRGQAAFRLLQTEALSGSVAAAQTVLDTLVTEDEDNPFAVAGAQWLASYRADGDAAAACTAVQFIFDRDTVTWQLTDHFGTDHPPLAPEEMCFTPRE